MADLALAKGTESEFDNGRASADVLGGIAGVHNKRGMAADELVIVRVVVGDNDHAIGHLKGLRSEGTRRGGLPLALPS